MVVVEEQWTNTWIYFASFFFFFLIDHQLPIKGYNLEQPDGREAKGKVWGKGTELLSLCIIIFLHLTGLLF